MANNKNAGIKEIAVVKRKTTEYIDAYMVHRKKEERRTQAVFDDTFSRFTLNVNNTKGEWASANIPVRELPEIVNRTKVARTAGALSSMFSGFFAVQRQAESRNLSPGYTVKLTGLGGRTAMNVIDAGEIKTLEEYYQKVKGSGTDEERAILDAVKITKEKRNNLAYSVKIKTGRLKGKSPADVLVETGEMGRKNLESQRDFLKKNLSQYPANNEQICAINAALELYKAGKLSNRPLVSGSPASTSSFVLYEKKFKANVHKCRADGKSKVTDVVILYNTSDNYPVEIVVDNYYAMVRKEEDGRLNVLTETIKDEDTKRCSMKLSDEEWSWQLWLMEQCMSDFCNLDKQRFKESDDALQREIADGKSNTQYAQYNG